MITKFVFFFIIFILSCHSQELPKAEALLSGRDLSADNDMQSLDNNKKDTENVKQKTKAAAGDSDSDSSSSDNSFSESDEAEELNRVQIKMPLELSLSDLANAILQQNQKYANIIFIFIYLNFSYFSFLLRSIELLQIAHELCY